MLGSKIDGVMHRADLVTAGNPYLAQRAASAGSSRIELLPTVVDLDRYPLVEAGKVGSAVVVGWIGSPSTAGYLQKVSPAAARLKDMYDVHFVAIGARPDQVAGTPFEAILWTESTEVEELQRLDIGIMPLDDGPWEQGKCGYKLIQYMACQHPVVASPVGVNNQIVEHGQNGFLAQDGKDWEMRLAQLIEDRDLRRSFGRRGRRDVERTYSLQVQIERLSGLFESLLKDGSSDLIRANG